MPTSPKLIQGLADAMRHLGLRQRVIAENIANGDTPGYKARTVDAPDFGSLVGVASGARTVVRPTVSVTSGMAALGAQQPRGANGVRLDSKVTETKPDGNNVTLEDQLLALGQAQADYAAMTSIYRKQMGLLRTAIGRGSP